ncbi:MAG TPA: response regulator [Candidatus Rifleibacterium sp.]|nr:response regulator [Candidatus Rifleibacterium sp.]
MCDSKEMTILVAEDDPGHAELIVDELKESGIHNPIRQFCNGQEVWDFLNEKDSDETAVLNYLLLLDIKMPKMDGIEVLKRIKSHNTLKKIPVIMVSTTDDQPEIAKCYELGCNMYITKPVDYRIFAESLKRLGLFIQIVRV